VKALNEKIKDLEDQAIADREKWQRDTDQLLATERHRLETSFHQKQQQLTLKQSTNELDSMKQEVQSLRREKSRLEADNLILVERIKQNMAKRGGGSRHLQVPGLY
jgi:superfamily II RNA helicase